MKIIIIQHEIDTPAGSTLKWLQRNGIAHQILLAPQTLTYPSVDDFDGVITLGGSMNVDEASKHPWLILEKEFIRSCIDAKKKTLGICLGSQLIAEVLGATVQSMNKWEIGWFDIQTANTCVPAFHFHQFNFNIPDACVRIASSNACKNQGYSYQDHVLAFQFHPEVDAAWIELALTDWDPNLQGAIQAKAEILHDSIRNIPLTESWYFQQLQSFFNAAKN